MEIKVLGTGCPKCKLLESNVLKALASLGIDAKVEKVTEVKDIISYGVMSTPALVVDNKVLFAGRVPSEKQLESLFKS